ncbi:MAG TPA: S53 family peptidase, partial [Chroococcales cyanobacterium]
MNNFSQHIVLVGSHRKDAGGLDLGRAQPRETLEVTLLLRRRLRLNIEHLAANRTSISLKDLEELHGAQFNDIFVIRQFAYFYGLKVSSIDSRKRLVKLSGSVEQLEAAFRIELRYRKKNGGYYRCRRGSILVPKEISDCVMCVLGLDNRPQAQTRLRFGRAFGIDAFKPDAFDGQQLAQVYNFPKFEGSGQTIAIIELGGGYNKFDLALYFAALGLPTPEVSSVSVDGAQNLPAINTDADSEVELDIQVAGSSAPLSKIVVYFAPNTDAGFLNAILTAIHDVENKPDIISVSWGAPEVAWTQQAMIAMDDAFQSAAALGISVFVAAGDDGSNDNVGDGRPHVDFPASSPWVTACGGTTLKVFDNGMSEVVWNNPGGGATGGGISDFFPRPLYQSAVTMPLSLNSGKAGRGLPDVAANADPATGYATHVDGLWYVIGGTSAVAPLFAGLAARLNQALGRRIGLINSAIYSAGIKAGFNSIVAGNNSAD